MEEKVQKATDQIVVGLMDVLFKKNTRLLKNIDGNINIKVLQIDIA